MAYPVKIAERVMKLSPWNWCRVVGVGFLIQASPGNSAPETGEAPPVVLSTSPDGKFILRREREESTDLGEARKRLELCSSQGRILYAWTSGLGATSVLWGPDSRFLAINDMPGDGGDLLRIFSLDPSNGSVTPLRAPDGKKLRADAESRHGNFLSRIESVRLRAVEWKGGRLWCELDGVSCPKREPAVHVPFHDLWVFGMQGTNSPELVEEWTRNVPKDRPYRDDRR